MDTTSHVLLTSGGNRDTTSHLLLTSGGNQGYYKTRFGDIW